MRRVLFVVEVAIVGALVAYSMIAPFTTLARRAIAAL